MKQSAFLLFIALSVNVFGQTPNHIGRYRNHSPLSKSDSIMEVMMRARAPKFEPQTPSRSVLHQLDSTVYFYQGEDMNYYRDGKLQFTYSGGTFVSVEELYVDENNVMVPGGKEVWVHDAEGKWLSNDEYVWDDASEEYKADWRHEVTYDAFDRIVEHLESYNTGGGDEFNSYWKNLYEYDTNGDHTSTLVYRKLPSDPDFILFDKHDFSYDMNHNLVHQIKLFWDGVAMAWIESYQLNYSYDASDYLLSIETAFMDAGEWRNETKHDYTNDGSGNLLSDYYYAWDVGSSSWSITWKVFYTYDASGNRLTETRWDWYGWVGEFVKVEYEEYSFNPSVGLDQLIFPYMLESGIYWGEATPTYDVFFDEDINQIRSQPLGVFCEFSGQSGVYDRKQVYHYYSDQLAGVTDLSQVIEFYPNPADSYVQLQNVPANSEVVLLDTGGKRVKETVLDETGRVSLDGVNAGLYFFTVRTESTVLTGKLIVR